MCALIPGFDMAQTKLDPFPIFITTKQVADILRINKRTLHYWINDGKGPPRYQFGKFFRFRKDEVLDWINNHKG